MVHGDAFRVSGCERVKALPCPYCVKGEDYSILFIGRPKSSGGPLERKGRHFDKVLVRWRITGSGEGEAVAWSEVS